MDPSLLNGRGEGYNNNLTGEEGWNTTASYALDIKFQKHRLDKYIYVLNNT